MRYALLAALAAALAVPAASAARGPDPAVVAGRLAAYLNARVTAAGTTPSGFVIPTACGRQAFPPPAVRGVTYLCYTQTVNRAGVSLGGARTPWEVVVTSGRWRYLPLAPGCEPPHPACQEVGGGLTPN